MAQHTVIVLVLFALAPPACAANATPPPNNTVSTEQDAAELFRRGKRAAEQGDTVRAEQYLSLARDRGFDERKILPTLLRVCLSSSRLRAALNHAEPFLREHPDDQNLRYLVATIQMGLGQLDEARALLNYVLHINPNNARAHYLLGVLESGTNAAKATKYLRNVVQVDVELILDAAALEEEAQLSFWDALIVEAARDVPGRTAS